MREIFTVTDNRENFLTAKISRYTVHVVLPDEGDDSSMESFTCQSSICDFHSWFGSPSVTMCVDNCVCMKKQRYGMMSNVGVHQSSCVALLEV